MAGHSLCRLLLRLEGQLSVSQRLREVTNDRQLYTLSVHGANQRDQPDNEHSQTHQLQKRQSQEDGGRGETLHHSGQNVDDRPGSKKEN